MKVIAGILAMGCSCLLLDGAAQALACSDAELHRALLEHDKARIAFRYNMVTGYARRAGRGDIAVASQRNEHLDKGPAATIDAIKRHLRALDEDGATFALVYDPSPTGCVWLLGPQATPISAQSNWHPGASAVFRDALGVTARSAARSPRLRDVADLPAAPRQQTAATSLHEIRYQLLPPRIARQIEASARRLLILPAHDLSAVPFAAMPMHEPGKLLIDYAVPVVVPSVDALFFWVKAPSPPDANALVVGDPDLSEDPNWEFPVLPGARQEAETVAQLTHAVPLLGAEATFDAVDDGLSRPGLSLIYFATHGVADADNPMDESFLALANAHLKGARIKRLEFPSLHPLVVMSTYQTALGKPFTGGTFGLARAWIHAGASQVLASHWNVDDRATQRLMQLFIVRRRQGINPEDAFWQAMLETRREIHDPALWGGFILFGYPQPTQG